MEHYIVIEVQINEDNVMAVLPPVTYTNINDAYAKMYTVLAAAAVSTVREHSCFIIDARGNKIDGQTFLHLPATPPESEEAE